VRIVRLSSEAVDEIGEGLPTDLEIRRALLPRFPYAVVFMTLPVEVRVLALPHVRRRPDDWGNRIATD